MLRQRVITALLLIPLAVAGVLFLPSIWVGLILALVTLLAATEWCRLSGIGICLKRPLYLLLIALGIYGAGYLLQAPNGPVGLLYGVALWWFALSAFLISRRQQGLDLELQGVSYLQLALGIGVLLPAWLALVFLHTRPERGPELMLFLLVMIWVADSGAYFAGKRWGRTKLAPGISPGKTLEGVAGALGGVVCCGLIWSLLMGYDLVTGTAFVGLCLVTAVASIFGDLFESLMKRLRKLKDSGEILPGHGGVLDRIDSLTAAAPVFAAGLAALGFL